jgi:hypothetical protein
MITVTAQNRAGTCRKYDLIAAVKERRCRIW